MDDDLNSLRGSLGGEDDDLFGAFSDPTEGAIPENLDMPDWLSGEPEPASEPEPEPAPSTDEGGVPEWLSELGEPPPDEDEEEPSPMIGEPETAHRERKRRSRSSTFLGLTPQQRMVLSIFLFLDVAVLGFLLLLAIGAISF
ncbi:MAG TPA: hypothetical protein ENI95_04835 [Chloroflexi bacterium]|nr:hypothetical protein [Chloroflexota bacterium]